MPNPRNLAAQSSAWNVHVAAAPSDVAIDVPKAAVIVPGQGELALPITIDAREVPLGGVRHAVIELTDGVRTARLPLTIVRRQPAVTLSTTCSPTSLVFNASTTCSITMANTSFEDDAPVSMTDELPPALKLVPGSITGGAAAGQNTVTFTGTISAVARDVVVAAVPLIGGIA